MKLENRERRMTAKIANLEGFRPLKVPKVRKPREGLIGVSVSCHMCRNVYSFRVPKKSYLKWVNKEELIQVALPNLSVAERELLISKTCSGCYEKLTGMQ